LIFPGIGSSVKPSPEIGKDRAYQCNYQSKEGNTVNPHLVAFIPGNPVSKVFDIGCRKIIMSQLPQDGKMPFGKRTKAKSIKNTKYCPGSGSQYYQNKIHKPCPFPYPSEQDEKDQQGMKDQKKCIGNSIEGHKNLIN